MIPKIIHYCWFGRGVIPAYLQSCIDSWSKLMPDYEFKCWSEDNFDINSVQFVKEAYEMKKYAFVSDYVRIYALYNEGGIYLDTDVIAKKRFDEYLKYNFVSGVEWHEGIFTKYQSIKYLDKEGKRIDSSLMDVVGCGILAAVMMSSRHTPFLKDILDWYDKQKFVLNEGKLNLIVSPAIYAVYAEKYGFRYKNVNQFFGDNYAVFSSNIFSLKETLSDDTVALHIGYGSWIDDISLRNKVSRFMKKYKITNSIYKYLKQIMK